MFTFFLLYYGNVVGLEPGLAGLAIAIALFLMHLQIQSLDQF